MIFLPLFGFAQVNESFLDGNLINNPFWEGATSNFIVNSSLQLQSNAQTASTSTLFTASQAYENAQWDCWIKIQFPASSGTISTYSSNYAAMYIASNKNDISTGFDGYFVKVGDIQDDVSLWLQQGNTKTKIIDGKDKRTDGNPIEIRIRVTRDADGNFSLYSKLSTENDYYLEGKALNTTVKSTSFFGLSFVNSSKTGTSYYFDDIVVTGSKALDKEPPSWTTFSLEQPNILRLVFSESMDFSKATFTVDNAIGSPVSQVIDADFTTIELLFPSNFEKGKVYTLQTTGLSDLAGNALLLTHQSIGITEKIELGDVIINEIMFENPLNSVEYLELYNTSDKLLDVSGLVFTTRKTDGTLNTGNSIPAGTKLLPKGYLAVCSDAEIVRNFHNCPAESNIITVSWATLNNENSILVLTNSAKDSIYDEVNYSAKWHSSWVNDPKGIALERNSPTLSSENPSSWHSAISVGNYGTPGYKNSEFIDVEAPLNNGFSLIEPNILRLVFSESMDFSKATFTVDNAIGSPVSQVIDADFTTIELLFPSNFEKGKVYTLQTTGLSDLAGNALLLTHQSIGITEKIELGDVIINEIMFENPLNSVEYLELYNTSDKLLDVSDLVFTTRKTDGTLNTGNSIPASTKLLPKGYLAVCEDATLLRNYYNTAPEANIVTSEWSTLSNESSSVVLTNLERDTVYDELSYTTKWHHALVKNPKGVALERIHPSLTTQLAASWHSASSEVNYGTPGYQNSQYRDIASQPFDEKTVWLEPESFSPDNDGVNDVCLIYYKTDAAGFVANIAIYNAIGVKVAQLASNYLLSTNGFLLWDGRNDDGRNANVGVYVVYFEMFNPENGQQKQLKLPIVVSSR